MPLPNEQASRMDRLQIIHSKHGTQTGCDYCVPQNSKISVKRPLNGKVIEILLPQTSKIYGEKTVYKAESSYDFGYNFSKIPLIGRTAEIVSPKNL